MKLTKIAICAIIFSCHYGFCQTAQTTTDKEKGDEKTPLIINELDISADKLEADLLKNTLILEGNIKAQDDKMIITADRMIVTLNKKRKPLSVEAIGNVVFRYSQINAEGEKEDVVVRGGHAIYQVVEETLVVTLKPVIERLSMRSYGMEKIVYERKTGKVKTEGTRPEIGRVVIENIRPNEFITPNNKKTETPPQVKEKTTAVVKPKSSTKSTSVKKTTNKK